MFLFGDVHFLDQIEHVAVDFMLSCSNGCCTLRWPRQKILSEIACSPNSESDSLRLAEEAHDSGCRRHKENVA